MYDGIMSFAVAYESCALKVTIIDVWGRMNASLMELLMSVIMESMAVFFCLAILMACLWF